ncbi:hypothetical protein M115_0448 [Bacteroides fragilis str. 3719 T6]|nr:hypothetical protein M115_0448 [Bacteroides fragilis str. 3719 T6]
MLLSEAEDFPSYSTPSMSFLVSFPTNAKSPSYPNFEID